MCRSCVGHVFVFLLGGGVDAIGELMILCFGRMGCMYL